MMQERIQTRYRLSGPFASQVELEQAIAHAINTHQQDFFPLLERLVDIGDSRVNLSQENPLRVLGITLDNNHQHRGIARLNYESNFTESCRLIYEYNQHQTNVGFHLEGDQLIFDIGIPPAWNFYN